MLLIPIIDNGVSRQWCIMWSRRFPSAYSFRVTSAKGYGKIRRRDLRFLYFGSFLSQLPRQMPLISFHIKRKYIRVSRAIKLQRNQQGVT
jgi:hypothetical protein